MGGPAGRQRYGEARRLVRIAILIGPKSAGSNMRAIAEAFPPGSPDAEVVRVVAPSAAAPGLDVARRLQLPVAVADPSSAGYAETLLRMARDDRWDLVCLAGFLRLLPPEVLEAFPRRVLNIHPALLPRYGGRGMYGRHVHEAVLAAGERESGVSVHFVDREYDEGEVLHQLRCPVLPDDTPETLASRIRPLEHQAYVESIRKLLADPRG